MKKTEKYNIKDIILYTLLTVVSVAVVFIANRITTKDALLFTNRSTNAVESYLTRVDVILKHEETVITYGDGMEDIIQTEIEFTCTCLWGENRGKTFVATQSYDSFSQRRPTPAEPGDWIYIYNTQAGSKDYLSGNFFRVKTLAWLFLVMVVCILVFARVKGIATTMSLGLTIASVFFVFVPAILSGFNIYKWTLAICCYSICITPPFVGGFNKKSLASIIGCIGGVGLAAALTAILNSVMKITGMVTEEDMYVVMLLDEPIDMRALEFAAIIIGALGSTMDVSMSIAASVWEMAESSGNNDFKSLMSSGFNIGRDILGTQISTLVLAYIGSNLGVVLLYVAYQPNLMEMLNVEAVTVQLYDALIGAMTIIFTIPFTAIVSAIMLSKAGKKTLISEKKTTFRVGH